MKRRRNVLSQVKGYRFGRRTKERQAKEAISHAGVHAFRDRRDKKGNMRRLFQIKINTASRANGLSYSKLIDKLNKANIKIDRKVMSMLAETYPTVFTKVVEAATATIVPAAKVAVAAAK